MAEDYNNHEPSWLKGFSKVKVKPESLSFEPCDDNESQIEMKFVEENVVIKLEENSLFSSELDGSRGNKECYEDDGIFPDLTEASDLNSSVSLSTDPLNSDTSGLYIRDTISSSEVIKTEQVNALDKFYDESEYQEEEEEDEEEFHNNYDDPNDPVDTLLDLDNDTTPGYVTIRETSASTTKFSFPNCDRTFSGQSYLTKHITSHQDSGDRSFPCPLCEQTFHFKNNLNLHINNVHKKPSTGSFFPCPLCDQNFHFKNNLNLHINNVHNHKKPSSGSPVFNCTICHVEFKYKKSLTKHMAQHKKIGQLNSLTGSKNEVLASPSVTSVPTKNKWSPTPAKYKCEPCNKLFWKHAVYANHNKLKHHPRTRKRHIANLKKQKILKLKSERSPASSRLEDDTSKTCGSKRKVGRPKKIHVEIN